MLVRMKPLGSEEHRVVTAILRREGRVLLCHRSRDREWYPDTWDLPGGHVEGGERPQDALSREMHEELGIAVVASSEPIARVQGDDFLNTIWLIDVWTGEPVNLALREHDALGWFSAEEIRDLDLADPRMIALLDGVLT